MQCRFSITDGVLAPCREVHSPNQDERPEGEISAVILHNISLPPGCFGGSEIEAFFTNCLDVTQHPFYAEIDGVQVSSHVLIRRDGELVQFVPFTKRAWHAGLSSFRGRDKCNDFSIGIELEGTDEDAYTDAQYATLIELLIALFDTYPALSARQIAAHSDIAPGRKTDPGTAFDWLRLYDGLNE
jgi:AmpD protein